MLIVSVGLSLVYGFYGIVLAVDAADGLIGYTSYLQAAEIPGVVVALSVFATGLGLSILFGEARTRYREYYLQYLVLDFIAVHQADTLVAE